jgi:hypothetical protein
MFCIVLIFFLSSLSLFYSYEKFLSNNNAKIKISVGFIPIRPLDEITKSVISSYLLCDIEVFGTGGILLSAIHKTITFHRSFSINDIFSNRIGKINRSIGKFCLRVRAKISINLVIYKVSANNHMRQKLINPIIVDTLVYPMIILLSSCFKLSIPFRTGALLTFHLSDYRLRDTSPFDFHNGC